MTDLRELIAEIAADLSGDNPVWTAGCLADALMRRGIGLVDWRPIDTAPRDGWHAPILTCRMGEPARWFGDEPVGGYAEPPEAAYWNEYGDCWTACHRPHDEWAPTHWMPMLAPPAKASA